MIDRLHYISQASTAGSHLESIEQVLKAGGKWIQLRIKDQNEAQILQIALQAKEMCQRYGAILIVNDHPHLAKKVGCDGVHLGLQDMPIAAARTIAGPDLIIGGTANTFEDILLRVSEGSNYIGLGPYRFTKTKNNLSPIIGLEGYKHLMRKVQEAGISVPIVAIGGIDIDDLPALMNTGIYGVALSGALTNQEDLMHKLKLINTTLTSNSYTSQYVKNSR
jgi:thiamine-phosphate pyrophosphorylase